MFSKLLIVLILNVSTRLCLTKITFREDSCIPDEECILKNGKQGIYRGFKSCKLAQILAKENRYSEVQSCGYIGNMPIVCCPESSQKFKDALCQDPFKPMPLKMEFNVVGGKKASVGEFPFQVALGHRDTLGNKNESINFNCGGSLIADDIVLTAAHCVRGNTTGIRIVRLGRVSLH